MLYAYAMVLDADPKQLITEIGHNGSAKVFKAPEPGCYRGFSIYEFIKPCLLRGKVPLFIPSETIIFSDDVTDTYAVTDVGIKIPEMLDLYPAIMQGYGRANTYHAVAWDNVSKQVFDSDIDKPYQLSDFSIVNIISILPLDKPS